MRRYLLTVVVCLITVSVSNGDEMPYVSIEKPIRVRINNLYYDVYQNGTVVPCEECNRGQVVQAVARTVVQPAAVQPAVVRQPVRTVSAPLDHTHRCTSCGRVWNHSEDGGLHRCPSCGKFENRVHSFGTQNVRPVYRQVYTPVQVYVPCQFGNCRR